MTLKQAQDQLARIEREIAALEGATNEYMQRQAAARLPQMRAAAEQGRAWIAANFPNA